MSQSTGNGLSRPCGASAGLSDPRLQNATRLQVGLYVRCEGALSFLSRPQSLVPQCSWSLDRQRRRVYIDKTRSLDSRALPRVASGSSRGRRCCFVSSRTPVADGFGFASNWLILGDGHGRRRSEMWVRTPISVEAVFLPRVRRPDRGLDDEPAIFGLQHAHDQLTDVRRMQLGRIFGLRMRRLALAKARLHLARVDLH